MVLFVLSMILLTAATALAALCMNTDLGLSSVIGIVFDKYGPGVDPIDSILVWDLGLPRIVSALLAGVALGAAGAVMQCVLRNPLGSPYTLGISNAAAFGASIG
ncbi:MAG: iron chelate uptake ABC transporter family permease subunit, partial [Candidatus Methanomethylophilaceae archaeon]|nr:iron chelate uptake ABC transporter family permease subunit [Candidatus Methanomethylophilaceae archaeon]